MRVKLFRPAAQRRARLLLAIALLLPAAGILQASGPNPVSLVATIFLVGLAVFVAVDAFRPTATITRHGVLIRSGFLKPPDAISWGEISEVSTGSVHVSITIIRRVTYHLHVEPRVARFFSRMLARRLLTPTGTEGQRETREQAP